MAEELFSGFDGQKILAERANKDINGNSLELTISGETVTAIGGKTVGGGMSSMLGKSEFGGTILDNSGEPITDNTGEAIQDATAVELYNSFETTKFGAERARADAEGNDIATTYATKAYVNTILGDIETILASI